MAEPQHFRLLPTTFLASFALSSSACVVAAAGVGAGGAVYVTERDVESQVALPVDAATDAVRQAFRDLGIVEGRYATEQDGSREERTLTGTTEDREVRVKVRSEGSGSRVSVTVRRDEVGWDKKLARDIVDRVVRAAAR